MKEFVYVRRLSDGVVYDIPATDLFDTMATGKFERLEYVKINSTTPQVVIEETATKTGIACPLCDKEFKSEHGLKVHKASHK